MYTRQHASAHVFAFAHLCLSVRLCVCVYVCVHMQSDHRLSTPASSPALFCFVFSPPLAHCRKQTLALCVLSEILLPFQGIRWAGKCCAGMPGPLPEAGLLFLLIIEQKLLVVPLPWTQTSTGSLVLSFCHLFFSVGPRGMAAETVFSDLVA